MEPPAGTSKLSRTASAKTPAKSKSAPQVVFITSDASGSKESRQAIRRRAAQHSHQVGRKKPKTKKQKLDEERENAASKGSGPSQPGSAALVLPLRDVKGNSPLTEGSSATDSSTSTSDTPPSFSSESDQLVVVREDAGVQVQVYKSHASALTLRHALMNRDSITTSTYPVPGKPWFPRFLEFMWDWMGKSWQAMDTTAAERASALSWVQCVTMTEPCYFYMNMLSVADTLQDRNQIEPWKVLWLTNQVVKSINSALNDPARMQSAGVILAVGRIALEEIVTGNRDNGERFHRPAQARLIAMAGGLEALGLPSLVLKHVCWADRVLTRITDVSMMELNPDVGINSRSEGFIGPVSVDRDLKLLNKYRPQRRRRHGEI